MYLSQAEEVQAVQDPIYPYCAHVLKTSRLHCLNLAKHLPNGMLIG